MTVAPYHQVNELGLREIVDAIVALGTLALACATFWLARLTKKVAEETHSLAVDAEKSSYRQIGVQTWLAFRSRFDSPEMIKARSDVAKKLQQPQGVPISLTQRVEFLNATSEIPEIIPNFFEDLGLAYKHNFVEREMARETFGYYGWRWNLILESYIAAARREHNGDRTIYCEFDRFAKAVSPANRDSLGRDEMNIHLEHFLRDESQLVPPPRLNY